MNNKGFTLIEILLSLALLAIISAFSWPFFSSLQSNNLEAEAKRTTSYLRQAATLSRAGIQDETWGVLVDNNGLTLFAGDSYANRLTEFDQTSSFTNGVSSPGSQEIIFSKYQGVPNYTGQIVLISGDRSRLISINSLGVIYY